MGGHAEELRSKEKADNEKKRRLEEKKGEENEKQKSKKSPGNLGQHVEGRVGGGAAVGEVTELP